LVVRRAGATDDDLVDVVRIDARARQGLARDRRSQVTGVLAREHAAGAGERRSPSGDEHRAAAILGRVHRH
jgi:hypothetical protein